MSNSKMKEKIDAPVAQRELLKMTGGGKRSCGGDRAFSQKTFHKV